MMVSLAARRGQFCQPSCKNCGGFCVPSRPAGILSSCLSTNGPNARGTLLRPRRGFGARRVGWVLPGAGWILPRARWILPSLAFGTLACGNDRPIASTPDGAATDAQSFSDAGIDGDASAPLGWVDFAISGCATGDGSEASPCLGQSPLILQFTALAPAQIDSHVWSFGDGSMPDPSLGPIHRFSEPGSYDIGLNVDGPGGSAGRTRLAAVVVIPASLGSVCDGDSQCSSADCLCGSEQSCPPPLATGMCVLDCESHEACGANLCIDLGSDGVAPWSLATCLPSCDPTADDCGTNASCQALLGVDGEFGHACFATGLLAPIGASCRDANDELDDARCASGVCADLGQRGMCTASCDTIACPLGTACVTPTGGVPGPLCVATCADSACDSDPLLSCRAPDNDFTVVGDAIAEGYCTPSFP